MEVSYIKFRENFIQTLLRNLDLKFCQNLQSENFYQCKISNIQKCRVITHVETFKTSYHSIKSDNPIKSHD
jgi:hypothetical protein